MSARCPCTGGGCGNWARDVEAAGCSQGAAGGGLSLTAGGHHSETQAWANQCGGRGLGGGVRCVRCAVCSVQMCAVLAAGRGEVNNGLPGMQRKVVLAMRRLYYMYLPHWQWRWRRRCETSRWSQEPADQRRLTTLRLVKVCGGSSNIQCTNGGGETEAHTLHRRRVVCARLLLSGWPSRDPATQASTGANAQEHSSPPGHRHMDGQSATSLGD